jgi:7,8-dihydropterin-6-yl-methyl-4-(beta-D-ribofuranosyl)aminobenzene 5'-phosphate synthase
MKLTVLMDNNTYIDRYYLGEPAVSYLIEDGARTILFDAGYSEAFIENAERLKLDLSRVTDIVLSHGHIDHTGGLPAYFERFSQPVRLIAHPNAFWRKRYEGLDAGSPVTLETLPRRVDAVLTADEMQVSENVCYLGEIPRVYPFEADRAVGETCACDGSVWICDILLDDTALALRVPDGIFVVSGCAHAGVCNTVAAAKRLCAEPRVAGLLGGFHLFETGTALEQTLRMLKELGVSLVYPCHCTSLAVKAAFVGAFDAREVGVGLTLEW